VTQVSVPWRPRDKVEYRGIARLLAGAAAAVYRLTAPVLKRWPAPIFFTACVLTVVVVWLHFLLFEFVDGVIASEVNRSGQTGWFGGPLTYDELTRGLTASSVPLAGVVGVLLYPLQYAVVRDVVILLGIIGLINLIPIYCIWWERKVSGRIQSRMGPMRVGGWHGWSQSIADGIKLICKEDLVPAGADGPLYRVAPYLAFIPAVLAFVALPFGTLWVFRDLDVGLVFILAMLGIEVIGVIIAGWASNNKWSVYGAMREACQMVSYEIPMGLSLLIPIMTVGALNLRVVGDAQDGGWTTWLAFRNPFLFAAFIGYYVAALASCKRAPFDLPESESELVAGFLTEYSGFRWSLFFLAEYAAMFVVSALAATLFLGAWHSPLPASWGAEWGDSIWARALRGMLFSGPLWFIFKATMLIYLQMWIRWTLPRIRIDQVLYCCVQVMLPLVLLCVLGNTLWELFIAPDSLVGRAANIALSGIGALFTLAALVIAAYGYINGRRLVGTLAVKQLPGA